MQDQEIKRQFQRKKFQLIAGILALMVWALGLTLLSSRIDVEQNFMLLGMLPGILVMGFVIWVWRCPACKSLLGKAVHLNYCPNCGVKLN